MLTDAVIARCARGLMAIANTLMAGATARPSRAEPEEPEPPRLRPSQQPGITMDSMMRAADRERKARRLPRSPEEARNPYWYR